MTIQKAAELKKPNEKPESHHQASELSNTVRVSNVLVLVSREGESQAPVEKHTSDQAARIPHNENDFIQLQPLTEEKEDACNIDDITAGFLTETTRHFKQQDKPEQPALKKSKLLSIDQTILDMAKHISFPTRSPGHQPHFWHKSLYSRGN